MKTRWMAGMLLSMVWVSLASGQYDLASGFLEPPASARPHTWWHWMSGNITKEGITADLESMARVGIGGAQIFNVGKPGSTAIPAGPIEYMTPEWLELVLHATREAVRVGIELCFHNCAGWTSSGGPWITPKNDPAPAELGIILLIALGCTAATAGAYWLLSKRWSEALAFIVPVAILLFLAHFIDGAATYRGLDAHGYSEKHVLPTLLIELTGTAAVMLPLKFLVVTAVVYLLDIGYAEDLRDTPTLTWLVKVAIMVLGLAPGIRDTLRLVMGV